MRANLRRRLEVLEVAHGKTPLGMARVRAILAMTREELIEAIIQEEKIRELQLEISESDDMDDAREVPPSSLEGLSRAELVWAIHCIDKLYGVDCQDEQDTAGEVELKHSGRRRRRRSGTPH